MASRPLGRYTALSRLFAPVLTHAPATGTSAEHALLLQAGYVRQTSAGVFAYLPLAHRVLRKIERIVERRMDEIGGQRLQLPVLTRAELWRRSGRLELMRNEVRLCVDARSSSRSSTDSIHSSSRSRLAPTCWVPHTRRRSPRFWPTRAPSARAPYRCCCTRSRASSATRRVRARE